MIRKNSVKGSTRSRKIWAVRFYLVGYLTLVLTLLAPISPIQNPPVDEAKAQELLASQNPKEWAYRLAKEQYGWGKTEQKCLGAMWGKESAWNHQAGSPTHDYGIPQRHMSHNTAEQIANFLDNPATQIEWGLNYIKVRYDSPCKAWQFWQSKRWY